MLSIGIVCLLAIVSAAIYAWCRYTYSYWERQGIPFMKPIPMLGNAKVMFTLQRSFFLYLSDIYSNPAMSNAAAVGVYILNKPALVVRDLQLIKSVMIKDFQKFSNRPSACDPHGDTLGANNLFFLKNQKWKEIRTKLTPVYTSGKVKQMYLLMREIGLELESHLTKQGKSYVTEVKEICALFTTDLIATTAFGVRANSLKNPNAEFRRHGRTFFDFTIKRAFDVLIAFFYPKWVSTFKVELFPPGYANFLRTSVDHVITEREQSKILRNDLVDVLVEMKKEFVAHGSYDKAARDFLVAQGAVFFTAGFETSSSVIAFALYEIAKHQDVQERLRNEICEAFAAEQGELSYDTITTLPYLNMVIDETLRMYPVLPFEDREHMPNDGEQPFDLRPYYDYKLPKDMPVYIPAYGLHHDPKYWPNPETFDPERFNPERKKLIEPMTYLPFGTGPRNCVGSRIGLLQAKLGVVHFLKNHRVKFCDRTPTEMKFDPLSIVLQCKSGIYLNVVYDGLYDDLADK